MGIKFLIIAAIIWGAISMVDLPSDADQAFSGNRASHSQLAALEAEGH